MTRMILKNYAEIVVSMGDKLIVSETRELTSQWEFVVKNIVKNRLRRDLILLGYKDSLSKKNLAKVLKEEDNLIMVEVRFLLNELERRKIPQGNPLHLS